MFNQTKKLSIFANLNSRYNCYLYSWFNPLAMQNLQRSYAQFINKVLTLCKIYEMKKRHILRKQDFDYQEV